MRAYPRFSIPGVVEVPPLSDLPLVLDNISAGGLRVTSGRKPDPEGEYPITVKAGDLVFHFDAATVAWSEADETRDGAWKVGMKIKMAEEERKKLMEKLENADD